MKLKHIDTESSVVGYGSHIGEISIRTFECPCGKGTVVYEHDDIPGFKQRNVFLNCSKCNEMFVIDYIAGSIEVKKKMR